MNQNLKSNRNLNVIFLPKLLRFAQYPLSDSPDSRTAIFCSPGFIFFHINNIQI